jgi:hypothetical protein
MWGDKYFEIPEDVHRFVREIRKDRKGAIREISNRLAVEDIGPVTE